MVAALIRPHILSARDEQRVELPEGMTLADMVAIVWPLPAARQHAAVFVDAVRVAPEYWPRVRPKAGATVRMALTFSGGGDADSKAILATVAMIAITIVAPYAGAALAATGFGTAIGLSATVAAVGITVVGSLAVQALFKPPSIDAGRGSQSPAESSTYSISGQANAATPYGAVPRVYGRHRLFPRLAAVPFAASEGPNQYLYMLLDCGYGPLEIEALSIGDTPIANFRDVQYFIHPAWRAGDPLNVYRNDVHYEQLSIALAAGVPEVRITTPGTSHIAVELSLPRGLVQFDDRGNRGPYSVQFAIAVRPAGSTGAWTPVNNFPITSSRSYSTSVNMAPVTAKSEDTGFRNYEHGFRQGRTDLLLQETNADIRAGDTLYAANKPYAVISVYKNAQGWQRVNISPGLANFLMGDTMECPVSRPQSDQMVVTDSTAQPVFYSISFPVPAGQYEVRVTRTSGDSTSQRIADELAWLGLRSSRAVAPIATREAHTIIELKIRGNEQLSGVVQNVNCIATSILPVREEYAALPGTLGATVSTPDSAANSITGEVDIRAKVKPGTWNRPSGGVVHFDFLNERPLPIYGAAAPVLARSGVATRVNANGLIEVVAANLPRFDYDPITRRCRGLLLEEVRTNVYKSSEDFRDPSEGNPINCWMEYVTADVEVAQITGVVTAPNGAGTVSKLRCLTVGVVQRQTQQNAAMTDNTIYTVSVFAKAAEVEAVSVYGVSKLPSYPFATFDLISGTMIQQGGGTAGYGIENYGGGWFRCYVSFDTKAGATSAGGLFQLKTRAGAHHGGAIGDGLYLWGAQMEQGATLTSYVPTTSATVLRGAETDLVANIAGFYNAAEGTFVAEFDRAASSIYPDLSSIYPWVCAFDDGTSGERLGIFCSDPGTNNDINVLVRDGGANVVNFPTSKVTPGAVARAAFRWKLNDFAASGNGVAVGTDVVGTLPTVTKLVIGSGDRQINGHMRRLTYYPRGLSNAELPARSAAAANLADMLPTVHDVFVGKLGAHGNFGYAFALGYDGRLQFHASPDGSMQYTPSSSAAVPFAEGAGGWIGVKRSGNVVRFYTREDDDAPWVQLGDDQVLGFSGDIFDSGAALRLGGWDYDARAIAGTVDYFELRSGIDGAVVARFDPARAQPGASAFQSDTGETWTAQGGATFGSTFVERATRNPAWAYLDVLRGPAALRPLADARIDFTSLGAWGAYCDTEVSNGVDGMPEPRARFDHVVDYGTTTFALLQSIAAAGRATPTIRDGRHGIIVDQEQIVPVQMFTPRNSWGFSARRLYVTEPHGMRVKFMDPFSWQEGEVILFAAGYNADTALTFEEMKLFGITRYTQATRDALYMKAQALLRREEFDIQCDVESLIATRGDLVVVQHDVLEVGGESTRVAAIAGDVVTLVDPYGALPTARYGLRIRLRDGTVTAPIEATPVPPAAFRLSAVPSPAPAEGDLVAWGYLNTETGEYLVKNVAPGADFTATLSLAEIARGIYGADSGDIPAYVPPAGGRPTDAPPPAPERLRAVQLDKTIGREPYADLTLYWEVANTAPYVKYRVARVEPNGIESLVAEVFTASARVDQNVRLQDPGRLDLVTRYTVIGIDAIGKQSLPAFIDVQLRDPLYIPDAPQFLSSNAHDKTTTLTWRAPDDAANPGNGQVAVYEVRWCAPDVIAVWSAAARVTEFVPWNVTTVTVPSRNGAYLVKSVTASRVESDVAAVTVIAVEDLVIQDVWRTLRFQPQWSGVFDQVEVDQGGRLVLTKNADGTYPPFGVFISTEREIFNQLVQCRISSQYESFGLNSVALMKDWTPLALADPLAGAIRGVDWDASVWVNASQGAPNVMADWIPLAIAAPLDAVPPIDDADWRPLIHGEYTGREIFFAVVLESRHPNITPVVSVAGVDIDFPERQEAYSDILIPAAGLDFVFAQEFVFPPAVAVDLQDAAPGDFVARGPVGTAGVRIEVRNAGAAVGGVVDISAFGAGRTL